MVDELKNPDTYLSLNVMETIITDSREKTSYQRSAAPSDFQCFCSIQHKCKNNGSRGKENKF
jgi:hypothetical protein